MAAKSPEDSAEQRGEFRSSELGAPVPRRGFAALPPDQRQTAQRRGGKSNSAAKQQAARINGQQGGYSGTPGGRPALPIEQIPCTCGRADGSHASRCRRYQTLKKRESRNHAERLAGNARVTES